MSQKSIVFFVAMIILVASYLSWPRASFVSPVAGEEYALGEGDKVKIKVGGTVDPILSLVGEGVHYRILPGVLKEVDGVLEYEWDYMYLATDDLVRGGVSLLPPGTYTVKASQNVTIGGQSVTLNTAFSPEFIVK